MPRYEQKRFNGGEIGERLQHQIDLTKYERSLKKLKNGFVHVEGSVSNRPGTEFVCEVKDSSKDVDIIPFKFGGSNISNTYIIELGNNYARFIQNGGQILNEDNSIYELETKIAEENINNIDYSQNGDVITLTNIDMPPYELERHNHTNWHIEELTVQPSIEAPTNLTASWHGGNEAVTTYKYVVTAVKGDTDEESVRSAEVEVQGELESYWGVTEYIILNWNAVEDAQEYNIYRSVNGIFGFIGTAEGTTFKDTKIEPDLTSTAPIFKNPFEDNNYPAHSCWYQQRHLFSTLKKAFRTFVASQTGMNKNFNISRPLIATDAITINIYEGEMNKIMHIIPMGDLIVLTENGIWKVNGQDGVFCANPLPICRNQLSGIGANEVKPVTCGRMVLFIENGGQAVRDLGYELTSDNYESAEVSIWAKHLFEGKQVVSMAYAHVPYRLIYCVMSDGSMNVICYDKNQQVTGTGHYTTNGKYLKVVTVFEGNRHVPYFLIERNINGELKKYIERETDRTINKVSDGIFTDSSLQLNTFTPTNIITGLDHLEGKEVVVQANGGSYNKRFTVENGSINLDFEVTKATVGLPYTFELETLNIENNGTQGLLKTIISADVGIYKSREDFKHIGDDGYYYINARSPESINNSDLLISDLVKIEPISNSSPFASIKIIQDEPLPLSITSITTTLIVQEDLTSVQNSQ